MFRLSDDKVYYLQDYYPVRSKRHGQDSEAILEFKRGSIDTINAYAKMMAKSMEQVYDVSTLKGGYICVMPSHSKGSYSSSLRRLASYLCKVFEMNDSYNLIIRNKDHDKASTGGERSIGSHIATLEVNPQYSIQDKIVILLDDVTTTGNSIAAVRHILKPFNPRCVYAQTLAKTADDRNEQAVVEHHEVNTNPAELTAEECIRQILNDNSKSEEVKATEIQEKFKNILIERYKARLYLNERYGKYGKSFNDSFFDRVCSDNHIYAFVVGYLCLYTKNMMVAICKFLDDMIRNGSYKEYISVPKYFTNDEAKAYLKEKVSVALDKSNTIDEFRMNLLTEHIEISKYTNSEISYLLEGWNRAIRAANLSEEIDASAVAAKVGHDNRHIVISRTKK